MENSILGERGGQWGSFSIPIFYIFFAPNGLKIIFRHWNFISFIRSRLEFGSVVWHSSLTKTNENDLERVQKSALKLILKDEYRDYKNALKVLAVESLFERREKLCLKFAKKCLKNENFRKLFPLRKTSHVMERRKTEKYLISNMNTEIYKKSVIPSMLSRAYNGACIYGKRPFTAFSWIFEPFLACIWLPKAVFLKNNSK